MATAHHIQVAPTDSGLLKFEQDTKTANEVTALLQKDLEVRALLQIVFHLTNMSHAQEP